MSSQGYEYWERRIIRDRETEALEQRCRSRLRMQNGVYRRCWHL